MKSFLTRALVTASCAAGSLSATGCLENYRKVVDPCYPARYECEARHEVLAAFGPQVLNGHVLDQTLFNYHFETGTERLSAGGMAHLDYLTRRRPSPDPRLFIATARDLEGKFDAAEPEKLVEVRRDLDNKRISMIQRYLSAQTANRPTQFEIFIHDPQEPGIPAIHHANAMAGMTIGVRYQVPRIATITTSSSAFGSGGNAAPAGSNVAPPGGVPGGTAAPPGGTAAPGTSPTAPPSAPRP